MKKRAKRVYIYGQAKKYTTRDTPQHTTKIWLMESALKAILIICFQLKKIAQFTFTIYRMTENLLYGSCCVKSIDTMEKVINYTIINFTL